MSATSPSRRSDSVTRAAIEEITPSIASRRPAFRRRTPRWHAVAEWGIRATALIAILAIVAIFAFILSEALPLFTSSTIHQEVTPGTMWWKQAWEGGPPRWLWQPNSDVPKYSLVPLVLGTLKITAVSVGIGAPIAVLAAIFTASVAPRWLREIIKPTIELLAGIPSVVLGVFALVVMGTWLQRVFGFEHRLNAVLAGAALSLTLIPLVFTIAEDAISAVPRDYVDASLALGASRMHTVFNVVVPAALPGIGAGIVLGVGRAVGETMVVLIASGNAAISSWALGLSTRTVTATIAQEMAEVVHGSPHYVVLFGLGGVLLVFTLITNIAAQRIVEHFRKKRGGS
jgi:phosphate transport system permease protein